MSHTSEIAGILAGPKPRVDLIAGANGRLIKSKGEERHDMVTTRQLDRAAKARRAAVSVRGSGGGASAPADGHKNSVRDELYAAYGR